VAVVCVLSGGQPGTWLCGLTQTSSARGGGHRLSKFALLFILIFASGIVATLFFNGSVAFILYQLIYFLNPDNRWWAAHIPGISYSFVASVLMLGVLAVRYRFYSAQAPWNEQPAWKWLLALLAVYYLGYFFALDVAIHDRFTFNFAKLVIIVLVAYKLLHSHRLLDASIWAYITGATYIGYVATITGRNHEGRVEGIGMVDAPDANDTAAALVPAVVLLLYYAWMGNKKTKLFCAFCGAFIANGLVLINSRGAFLGIVVGAGLYLLYMVFSRYRREGQRAMAVFIVILGLSGGLYVADDQFWQRMATLQNVEDEDASGSRRVNYWIATFDMMEDYPFGMGVHGYNIVSSIYLPEEYRAEGGSKSVHSSWFQGLSEVGWHGLFLFVMLMIALLRLSRKAKQWLVEREENTAYFKLLALECALLSYLVPASFINRFRAEILYWMILLLAVAVNVYYLQKIRKNRQENVKPAHLQPASARESET